LKFLTWPGPIEARSLPDISFIVDRSTGFWWSTGRFFESNPQPTNQFKPETAQIMWTAPSLRLYLSTRYCSRGATGLDWFGCALIVLAQKLRTF